MTKNIFIVAIAVLLSVAFCSLSAQNVSKDYNVDEFSAINLQSVGNIIFTQSAGCSCRLEGPSEFVCRQCLRASSWSSARAEKTGVSKSACAACGMVERISFSMAAHCAASRCCTVVPLAGAAGLNPPKLPSTYTLPL